MSRTGVLTILPSASGELGEHPGERREEFVDHVERDRGDRSQALLDLSTLFGWSGHVRPPSLGIPSTMEHALKPRTCAGTALGDAHQLRVANHHLARSDSGETDEPTLSVVDRMPAMGRSRDPGGIERGCPSVTEPCVCEKQ